MPYEHVTNTIMNDNESQKERDSNTPKRSDKYIERAQKEFKERAELNRIAIKTEDPEDRKKAMDITEI